MNANFPAPSKLSRFHVQIVAMQSAVILIGYALVRHMLQDVFFRKPDVQIHPLPRFIHEHGLTMLVVPLLWLLLPAVMQSRLLSFGPRWTNGTGLLILITLIVLLLLGYMFAVESFREISRSML